MSDTLTREQLQIQAAWVKITKNLQEQYERYMQEALNHPEDYEGASTDDAYIWFVEGL